MDISSIQELCQGLHKDKQGANNAPKLIAALSSSSSEAVMRAAIQALKLFFVESSQHLAPKRGQDQQALDAAADAVPDVFRQWLRRQYNAYISVLFVLITSKQYTAAVQTAATTAVMEAVRSEAGVGVFANDLYARFLAAVATAEGVKPEVYTLLFNRYFQYADVRYYSLWSVRSLALKHSQNAAAIIKSGSNNNNNNNKNNNSNNQACSAGMGKEEGSTAEEGLQGAAPPPAKAPKRSKTARQQEGATAASVGGALPEQPQGGGDAADAGGGSATADPHGTGAVGGEEGVRRPGYACVAVEDLWRNLYDIMGALPESLPASGGGKGDVAELQSWCGAAEVGAVTATSDKNESARARRKRKLQELPPAGGASRQGAAASEQRAMWANTKAQRRMFSDAWLALLQLPVPHDLYHKVLLRLHTHVIPHMMAPNMLADFLTYSLNQGGLAGMLALQGIFILVTQHGLEYPAFYRRLYNLVNQDAFAAKHRSQFFALADVFLSSPLVPAYTMASFAKRLARLALAAPPAGAMVAIAFIHNLMRRHPSCMVLLHNPRAHSSRASEAGAAPEPLLDGGEQHRAGAGDGADGSSSGDAGPGPGLDPYDPTEEDPAMTRAVESSLWELQALRNHYCPQVAALCTILDKDLSDRTKTTEVDISPLLIQSYTTLINQELERRLKQVPVAFYQEAPTKLFDLNSLEDFGLQ